MDYEQIRREEFNVLESVYGEDLSRDDNAFILILRPSNAENDTSVTLRVEYGDTYPSGPPGSIEIIESTGLAPDCRLHLSSIINTMVGVIGKTITIFDVIQNVQDFLHDQKTSYYNQEPVNGNTVFKDSDNEDSESDDQDNIILDDSEPWAENLSENQQEIQVGMPLNVPFSREQFLEWNGKFLQEYKKITEEAMETASSIPGKQMFLQNIVLDTDVEPGEALGEKTTTTDSSDMYFDASLYDDSDSDDDSDIAVNTVINHTNKLSQDHIHTLLQSQGIPEKDNDGNKDRDKDKNRDKDKDKNKKRDKKKMKDSRKDKEKSVKGSKSDSKKSKTAKISLIDKFDLGEGFTNILDDTD